MTLEAEECEKYRTCWTHDAYRKSSPAEKHLDKILASIPEGAHQIVDYGAGTGRAALALREEGYAVHMVDFAENCLDAAVRDQVGKTLGFEVACLWESDFRRDGDFGICCDVMEHIPEEKVDAVLANILSGTPHTFFQIDLVPDHYGKKLVGKPLHLTVKPATWWRDRIGAIQRIRWMRAVVGKAWICT